MGIIPDASRDATRHPDWCDTSRCQYPRNAGSKFGHHRSEPLTLGRVTAVLTQAPEASRPSFEVRTTTRLVPVEGDSGLTHAMFVLMSLDATVLDCARIAQEWQNDHSMRATHAFGYMSTPNRFGGEYR
jgi:hypothetical protein